MVRGRVLNINLLVQLLVLIGEIKTTAEVVAELETLLVAFGIDFYEINRRKRTGETDDVSLASKWPAGWAETYKSRRYALIDPNVRMLGIVQRPFRWRDAIVRLKTDPHRPRMDRLIQEAARHGLQDGYVFPIHGRSGPLGWVAIGGRARDLSPAELSLFDAVARRVFWRLLELRGEADAVEASARLDTPLTRREMEVILLLAEGMTSHEIARNLNISNHTVDWYINGLQEKLQANNRQHVVAIAFRLGLVT